MYQPNSVNEIDKSKPLVSIGCATYNGADTLIRALDALVRQDYPNIEIIICDDCSEDETIEICEKYADKYSNIRFIKNEENLGIAANCNKLFELGKGKYFLYADQDDVRDLSFVSKCVTVMEADESTVLCHAHTGVFWRSFGNLMHINRLDSIDNVSGVLTRYWKFLRTYSDTTIYGLIRSDALRQTSLWRPDIASSNCLLFELLLLGKFRQVPETLYFYSAKGFKYRPSAEAEYRRHSNGKSMPIFRKPFLVLAYNQTKGIVHSQHGFLVKFCLLLLLWTHVAMVNGVKLIFRVTEAIFGSKIPSWFGEICMFAVLDMRDTDFIVTPEESGEYLPELWLLRKN